MTPPVAAAGTPVGFCARYAIRPGLLSGTKKPVWLNPTADEGDWVST